jgi:hypothetical protein
LDGLVFFASVVLAIKAWLTWLRDILLVNSIRVPGPSRLPLLATPLLSLLLILVVLLTLAAGSGRSDPSYIGFYLVVGAGWLGGLTLIFPFLGISARDDVLERRNQAASWPIIGGLFGAACTFAGANIGDGPGVEAVLLSAILSSALFVGLWFAMDFLTYISEAITIERDERAGIRLGGFLIGAGVLSGWSVSGDWASASETLKDSARFSWPAILLTAAAVSVEFILRRPHIVITRRSSATIASVYVVIAIVWVAIRGFH